MYIYDIIKIEGDSKMKKITFGYSNDINPTGQFEGIGIKPGLLLCNAEYYGAVQYEGNSYIIAKVTEDEYNKYPKLLNNFIARKALCDIYADGSCILMLDQNENLVTQLLEEQLNKPEIKDKIKNTEDILTYCKGVHRAPVSFVLPEIGTNEIMATSIKSEEFNRKVNAIKNCHYPISDLQTKISEGYTR